MRRGCGRPVKSLEDFPWRAAAEAAELLAGDQGESRKAETVYKIVDFVASARNPGKTTRNAVETAALAADLRSPEVTKRT